MEIHPHCVVQIVSFKLQLAHGKERCAGAQLKSPQGFPALAEPLPPAAVTATGQASPRLQTWEKQDQFHSNAEGKESDEAMERLRKDRKTAFSLMDFCPDYSYKNHRGVSLSRRSFWRVSVWSVMSPCAVP